MFLVNQVFIPLFYSDFVLSINVVDSVYTLKTGSRSGDSQGSADQYIKKSVMERNKETSVWAGVGVGGS